MFMILLMLSSALSYLAYGLDTTQPVNLYCGIALSVIVLLQCTASYLEERKSDSVMASLKSMMPAQCSVVRDGKPRRVPASDLVVGDIVQLKGGDRVPADLRLIQTSGLKVESSSLTGEPDAFEMTVLATHEEPHESKNLAFNTTQCTEGAACGVVIRTADKTLIGLVAALATSTSTNVSTLQLEVGRVVKFITALAVTLAILVLIIGAAQKIPWVIIANLVITVFCANIPQGLPATVTSCLGIAAKRMHVRNVLVKNLEVIETLGCATCVCSDKTGTLTQNKMTVQNFWFNGSFEMLQGGVIIGATSTVMSSKSGGGGNESLRGAESLRRSHLPGSAIADLAQKMFIRWRANPLEPLLLIAAVCNSARFAAIDGEDDGTEAEKRGAATNAAPPELAFFAEGAQIANEPHAAPDAAAMPKRNESGMLDRQIGAGVKNPQAVTTSRITTARATNTAEILGDASEAALLRYCESIYPVDTVRKLYPRAYDVPFNSTNKYALCVVDPPEGECPGKQYIFLKGAPEVVLERCDRWLCAGIERPVDDDFRRQFQDAYERFAHSGERVLGFARTIIDRRPAEELNKNTVPTEGFLFMGLASLMDPPKLGVDKAVQDCRTAGIRVFMVTGDHALTAEAIAHKVNIITKPTRIDVAQERGVPVEAVDPDDPEIKAVVITGGELKKLTEEQWEHLLDYEELVFARTTPQQKLEIVEHLQARGEIVAVTGDGVNDSPALKKANIGVAMGSPNASDVAREAADIIILDDDFCSIVSAIREGRLLFDNLKKSIAYTLTHLVPEMVPVFINIILRFPLGLSSLLILTIDLGSELVPAISLAYEEPESAIMQRPPRSTKTDRMVTGTLVFYSYCVAGVMESIASFLAFFCIFWSHGIDLQDLMAPVGTTFWVDGAPNFVSRGNTFSSSDQVSILSVGNAAVYANIVLCQMFHLWFCRTRMTSVTQHSLFTNKLAMFAMPWELAFIAILCYIPQLQVVFTSGVGLPIQFWCLSLGFLLWVAVHTETVKYFARRKIIKGNSSVVARLAW